MKKLLWIALVASMFSFAAAPQPDNIGSKESRYMSRATDTNKTYDIQASTVMRTYTRDHDYLPLIIQVHNWSADNVTVTPEQFSLRSKDGKTLRPISSKEYLANHRVQGKRNLKYLMRRPDSGIESKPDIWYVENSRFYPGLRRTGGVNDRVNLAPEHYMIDWLYFPNTESGSYELVFKSANGETLVIPVEL